MTANNLPAQTAMPVTLSVLIPVYNVEPFLADCLDSILAQIDERAEVIAMNDASTDNSRQILTNYSDHPQITVLDAPHNRGLSATRNALLPHAKHDYIWFIDSDDIMHTGAYQLVMNQLEQTPVDVLFGDYIAWRDDYKRQKSGFVGKPNQYYKNENASFFKDLVKSNSNYAWNKVFKKSLLEQVQFQVGLKFEDIYYMADLSALVKDFYYCPSPLIDYRERAGSIIQTVDKKYVDDYLNAFIYRVETWYQLTPDAESDPFSDYLWYKSFNRFAGLVKKLADAGQSDLVGYVNQQYAPTFFGYQGKALKRVDFLRRLRLQHEAKKVKKSLNNF